MSSIFFRIVRPTLAAALLVLVGCQPDLGVRTHRFHCDSASDCLPGWACVPHADGIGVCQAEQPADAGDDSNPVDADVADVADAASDPDTSPVADAGDVTHDATPDAPASDTGADVRDATPDAPTCQPTAASEQPTQCGDRLDNDCDNAVDCDDSDCASLLRCKILWHQATGSSQRDSIEALTTDDQGNVYAVGAFRDTISVGNGETLTSNGGTDAFVVKYAPDGSVVWSTSFGNDGATYADSDVAYGVGVDSHHAVWVTGMFHNTMTVGSETLQSAGAGDIFLVKFDAGGDVSFARRFGSDNSNYDSGDDLSIDGNDQVVVVGAATTGTSFGNGADVGATTGPSGSSDTFVAKFSTTGDALWAQTFGGPACDDCGGKQPSVAVDAANHIYVAASYASGIQFSNTTDSPASAGVYDVLLAKYKPDGSVDAMRHYGGDQIDFAHDIAVSATTPAKVYVTGHFESASFVYATSPQRTLDNNTGSRDAFLLAVQGDTMQPIWARSISSQDSDDGRGVAVSSKGYVVWSGVFGGNANLGGAAALLGDSGDLFLASYDTSNSYRWAQNLGGDERTNGPLPHLVAVDPSDNIIAAGAFEGSIQFDDATTRPATGGNDIYIFKRLPTP